MLPASADPADLYKFKYGKKTNLNKELKFGF
jgi:hypothetical protein